MAAIFVEQNSKGPLEHNPPEGGGGGHTQAIDIKAIPLQVLS